MGSSAVPKRPYNGRLQPGFQTWTGLSDLVDSCTNQLSHHTFAEPPHLQEPPHPDCFSKDTRITHKIAPCRTVEKILDRLDQTNRRSKFCIESILDSIRGLGLIQDWKTDAFEQYYSLLLQLFTEVQERGQFDNPQTVSQIIRK